MNIPLLPSERRLLHAIASGQPMKAIAPDFGLSRYGAVILRRGLKKKLGIASRVGRGGDRAAFVRAAAENNCLYYNKAYFIAKFKAIPEHLWLTGKAKDGERGCAIGHCENRPHSSPEALAFIALWQNPLGKLTAAKINDGEDPRYQQPTPRARILAALRDLL